EPVTGSQSRVPPAVDRLRGSTPLVDIPPGGICWRHARVCRQQGRRPEAAAPHRGPGARPATDGRRGEVLHRRPRPGGGGHQGPAGRCHRAARRPPVSLRRRRPGQGRRRRRREGGRGLGCHRPPGQGVIHAVLAVGVDDLGRSLREGFFMFWETLWALILGFGLSGAVQAFASREEMQRLLGDHRPAALLRATGFGMVSSSCSYSATAMAKSLFQKGADFTAAMVFMFASTNLVIELGVVLLVLMGWQFAAAEFVGGPIMILLLVLVGGVVFRSRLVDGARKRLQRGAAGSGHDHLAMSGVTEERQHELEHTPWRRKLTSKAAWADAASYTMADITMLRKELVIGYTVAGLLAVLVPMRAWNDVFLTGHGFWTSLENVVVGPFIAVISFVCSIGNVPMAAALWHGGISFGGVVAFIFADLITLPLLLIYRKYYGTRLTLRLFAVFYAVMAVAGLAV